MGGECGPNYDYFFKLGYAASSSLTLQDPNTGYTEQFTFFRRLLGARARKVTYGSQITLANSSSVSILIPGGMTLNFGVTGYPTGPSSYRGRLTSVVDRNQNGITLGYVNPSSGTDNSVMELSGGTDAYGRATGFSYTSSFSGLNVVSAVTLSDSSSINYGYNTADNNSFVNTIGYGLSGGSSAWYTSGGSVTLTEALLPADHTKLAVTMQNAGFGRVGAVTRADGNYVLARNVQMSGGTETITSWNATIVRQTQRTAVQQLLAMERQRMDGSWEPQITYSGSVAYAPVTGYTEPPGVSQPTRTTTASPATPLPI